MTPIPVSNAEWAALLVLVALVIAVMTLLLNWKS